MVVGTFKNQGIIFRKAFDQLNYRFSVEGKKIKTLKLQTQQPIIEPNNTNSKTEIQKVSNIVFTGDSMLNGMSVKGLRKPRKS